MRINVDTRIIVAVASCNRWLICVLVTLCVGTPTFAQRQMEWLDRGLVAVKVDADVFLSWRMLGNEPDEIAFNAYRVAGESSASRALRLNEKPITGATNYIDRSAHATKASRYHVRAIIDGKEQAPSPAVAVWPNPWLEVFVNPPRGYRPGDGSVADLDGDGQYELVIHHVSQPRDNSHSGTTGQPILDAYEFDGTHLWRINLGVNIREGEHYTQFIVYDLDGDGRAEVACKTADGSTDSAGTVIGEPNKDWRDLDRNSRSYGRVLRGKEFLTIFDGRTGRALKTVDYVPGREPINGWGGIGGNGGNDNYGNRCDRFLACAAYLDGERPSLVMCRGVYGRSVLVAWDWRDGKLTKRWTFDSGIAYPPYRNASPYSGMGGHSLSVADVDNDGRDEIVYQAMVVDDNGKGLHTAGLRHGDVVHVTDMDPSRPGMEIFTIQENEGGRFDGDTPGGALRDGKTGKILWSHSPAVDVGQGLAADIDPRHAGYEIWGGPGGLRDVKGNSIGRPPRVTGFAVWWDGDLLRELLGSRSVVKWNWNTQREENVYTFPGRQGFRYPTLAADLIGDWREEVLLPAPDGQSLRLYTTTIPTEHRLRTLMHDPQYRLSIAWQNVAYNKPPHPGFFLGHNMKPPATPTLRLIKMDSQ